MKTDPILQLDAHLSRDITHNFWASLDGAWFNGGKATIDTLEGTKLNNIALGITLGYQINENLNLTFGYKSTINDDAQDALRMDGFMVTQELVVVKKRPAAAHFTPAYARYDIWA